MGNRILYYGVALALGLAMVGESFAQVPNAPAVPKCTMKDGKSNCAFKTQMTGTPTSVSGNRVIVFRKSAVGGHGDSRTFLDDAVKRLATRYNFTATITEDAGIFTAANLANTKVVLMNNGDGDVVPSGANRTALQDFQQVNGWGVIWIHAACAFITNGWPFGQQSCVQQYFHHNPSGTQRRIFLDSGTATSPNHGIKNPQTEFVLRNLPGWTGRTFSMGDEYYCFQSPARNTQGVNVMVGYDHSSGLPVSGCPDQNAATEAASQNHSLTWTHMMGQGISVYNSIGHDVGTYTTGTNAGDSLLWRYIRYAAKDWDTVGATVSLIAKTQEMVDPIVQSGSLAITFTETARNDVTVSDVSGKRIFAKTYTGVDRAEIPNLQRGIYYVKVASGKSNQVKQVRIL